MNSTDKNSTIFIDLGSFSQASATTEFKGPITISDGETPLLTLNKQSCSKDKETVLQETTQPNKHTEDSSQTFKNRTQSPELINKTLKKIKRKKSNKKVKCEKIINKNVKSEKIINKKLTSDKITNKKVTSDRITNKKVTSDRITNKKVTEVKVKCGKTQKNESYMNTLRKRYKYVFICNFCDFVCPGTKNKMLRIQLHLIHHPNQYVEEKYVDLSILKKYNIVKDLKNDE